VYHGWKFDTLGNCVDMPNEPAESDFRAKVRAVAYRCIERNGVIWAYLGPRQIPPSLPDFEANMLGEGSYSISNIHRPCNWMQGWEGEVDTAHQASCIAAPCAWSRPDLGRSSTTSPGPLPRG
jgi:phthalate 4,5-dioxygenase